MTQLIIRRHTVQCPVCDLTLTVEQEQDSRVAFMRHPDFIHCTFNKKLFRVDRISGFSEEVIREKPPEVQVPPRSQPPARQIGKGKDNSS